MDIIFTKYEENVVIKKVKKNILDQKLIKLRAFQISQNMLNTLYIYVNNEYDIIYFRKHLESWRCFTTRSATYIKK